MNDTPIGDRVRELVAAAKAESPYPEARLSYLAAKVESREWELRTLKAELERERTMNAEQIELLKAALGWGYAQPGIYPAAEPERQPSMEGQL